MNRHLLADTGLLVAYLRAEDSAHEWAVKTLAEIHSPLLTTEPVLVESAHLLSRGHARVDRLFQMLVRGAVRVPFSLSREIERIRTLVHRYANVPMSLADASLVCLSEDFPESVVMTLDSDFLVYRRHRDQAIPVLMPPRT